MPRHAEHCQPRAKCGFACASVSQTRLTGVHLQVSYTKANTVRRSTHRPPSQCIIPHVLAADKQGVAGNFYQCPTSYKKEAACGSKNQPNDRVVQARPEQAAHHALYDARQPTTGGKSHSRHTGARLHVGSNHHYPNNAAKPARSPCHMLRTRKCADSRAACQSDSQTLE